MSKRPELTLSKADDKYKRDRTKNLIEHQKDMDSLQTTPPKFLKGKARYAYSRVVEQLDKQGVVKQSDLDIVVSLAIQLEILQRAYDKLEQLDVQYPIYKAVQDVDGAILEHTYQGDKKNVAVGTISDATKNIKSLCNDLGLTPASRATLLQNIDNDSDTESLSDMINKGAGFW